MNNRPRKTLEFASPAEVFFKHFPAETMELMRGAFGP
jgi:IS30 family transposase